MSDPQPTAATLTARPRLLVLASTFPSRPRDGTPGFVLDLALQEAIAFDTMVLVPRVPGSAKTEQIGPLRVQRFGFFLRRFEDLADGAIIENLRMKRSRWLQVPFFFLAEILAVRRAIREFRPDVLHVHWVVPQGVAALAVGRDLPWLVTTLGADVYALQDPVSKRLKRAVLKRAARVTTMNDDMRARLVALGSPVEHTAVLPMGAHLTEVREAGAGVARVPGRVLFVGRLVEKKGAAILLEALSRLPGDLDWSLDIVGDGPLRATLEAQAKQWPKRVIFHGTTDRATLGKLYAGSSVIALPSVTAASGDQDGLPVTLLEAMGAGCAVVASRLAGLDEALTDGVSGVLVEPGDPGELARAIAGLLGDPNRCAQLGSSAAAAAEGYSVEAIGTRYVALLTELVGERGCR